MLNVIAGKKVQICVIDEFGKVLNLTCNNLMVLLLNFREWKIFLRMGFYS